tara:strand:- start:12696 stop:14693 length:1998 start_codon:yes stop_codon:yes gene_type:complete
MGIENVAMTTFNSTGSQSVCRANKYKEDTLIESDFLTKCTTKYINGTGQSVITGSLKGFPSGLPSQTSNHDIFNLPDDIDAISNINLTLRLGFDIKDGRDAGNNKTSFANSTAVYFSNTLLLSLIDKIEIKLGGLIVDTLTPDAIFARNLTENGITCNFSGSNIDTLDYPNIYTNFNRPNMTTDSFGATTSNGTQAVRDNIAEWSISIPFTGRSSRMNSAFLQAGSTTNTLSMKVYYNKFDPETTFLEAINVPSTNHEHEGLHQGCGGKWPLFGIQKLTSNASMIPENWKWSTSVTVTTHTITETEKNFIRNNIVNRVLKTSESIEYPDPKDIVSPVMDYTVPNADYSNANLSPVPSGIGEYKQISFDISNFDVNCSHILLSLRMPGVDKDGTFITNSPLSQPWPFTKGTRYDGGKLASSASGADYGPWPKKPLFDGWWSGVNDKESAGPLVPENNDGDFMMRPYSKIPHTRYPTESLPVVYNPAYGLTQTNNSNIYEGTYNNGILENVEAAGHDISDKFLPLVPPVGYVNNWLDSVELVIGGNRTGFIPATSLDIKNLDEFGLKNNKDACGIYAIKLADEAFSTAGVPFSKCNSIKLNIRIRTSLYHGTPLGNEAWQGGHQHSFHITPFIYNKNWTAQDYPKLVATAIGTTVQTTVGGSISFAA